MSITRTNVDSLFLLLAASGILEMQNSFVNRFRFPNRKWDNRNMMMTYDREQLRPSPLGMQSYESIDANSPTFGTDVFLHHDGIDEASQPCFSGDRVQLYDNVLNL